MRTFTVIRHIVIFLLGVLIIVDALANATYVIPKLIIGMIMVGVLPIENLTFRSPLEMRNKQSIDAMHIRDVESKYEAPE